jgi:hypothetical protein
MTGDGNYNQKTNKVITTRKNRVTSDDDKQWMTTRKLTNWSWLGGVEQKNRDEHHEPQLGNQQVDHNYNKQRKKQQWWMLGSMTKRPIRWSWPKGTKKK